MIINNDILSMIVLAIAVLCLAGIISIYFIRRSYQRRQKQKALLQKAFSQSEGPGGLQDLEQTVRKYPKLVIEQLRTLAQSFDLGDPQFQPLMNVIERASLEERFLVMLANKEPYKRIKAALSLSVLPGEKGIAAVEKALAKEQDPHVRLYLCSVLAERRKISSIRLMVESICGAPLWYRNKVSVFIQSYGKDFYEYLPTLLEREETEIQALITDFATVYAAEDLKEYLLGHVSSPNRDIAYRSVRAIGGLYPDILDTKTFLYHEDPVIRNIALEASSQYPTWETLQLVLPLLADEKSGEHAIAAVSNMARLEPRYLPRLISIFRATDEQGMRRALAKVLSNRIEYLLLNTLSVDSLQTKKLIGEIIAVGKINGIIGFLNKNRNLEIENEILPLLRTAIEEETGLKREFCLYLDERLLRKLDCERLEEVPQTRDERQERGKVLFLSAFLLASILFLPGYYVLRQPEPFWALDWFQHLQSFVIESNYFFAYYAGSINLIYLLLLGFSFLGIRRQKRYWRLKSEKFLFTPRMLPSVSIIAPAFCEEATIIESVHSLLNLKYPNYDLIVVNDGSRDNTLNRLIHHFNLEKVDRVLSQQLKTKPIRGLYINKDIPKLIVIDKANGGKADSLNAGINLSRKEYFCGIDADSLLEEKALLRLSSLAVDAKHEAVALGGNILPVNGSLVKNGMIVELKLAGNFLARLQTVEYLRAFMGGRLGWAYLKSLLIISGAFGLFRKDRVVSVGGYMTSSERFNRDTVGEDMELVVRLRRSLHEQKIAHEILYSYNANCWTEVPEKLSILERQRDRWQRGLLDILAFHRKLLFNPDYGRIGLLAMPYFLIFEMLGPILELQGYLLVIVAALLGLLDANLALLFFLGSVLMGILISVFSLLLAERDIQKYSSREMFILILIAIIENFGIRQFISLWRVSGYVNSLHTARGWGTMVRKGFATAEEPSAN